MADRRPLLAFTSGDPAGIGPEIIAKGLRSQRLQRFCRPLLVGERTVFLRAGWRPALAPIWDTALGLKSPEPGHPTAAGGRASFAAVRAAFELFSRGAAAGIVTAPVSKHAWSEGDVPFTDHTEYFSRSLREEAGMVLGSPEEGLWCSLATRHVPLERAIHSLTRAGVARAAGLLDGALRRLGRPRPRLVLAALNPHAGEEGLMGREERLILGPAARLARSGRLRLDGPLAADAAWRLHRQGEFDGVVCLYHDQALIALKAAAGLSIVNWTVGPPGFVRTSPGHGTAFDIAGKSLADPAGLLAAAELAARLARR